MEVLLRFASVKIRLRSETISAMFTNSVRSLAAAFGLFLAGLPRPGIAATGSSSCGGSVLLKPSLTKMIDLRPSRMPPSLMDAPLSAVIVTSLRTRSTVDAG